MYHYTVEDIKSSGCTVCCCEPLILKPGSTSKVHVNYAPWAVPIGRLHCLPVFDLEQKETCGLNTGAPQKVGGANVAFDTPMNTPLNGDLTAKIEDPEATEMKFRLLALYGPHKGAVAVSPDGTFVYTPNGGYNGPDRFYVTATDESGKTTTFEVLIGVGSTSSANMNETPHVSVDLASVNVDYQYYTASFGVSVAPTADLCEVWRLTVGMNAIDCECGCYSRSDCYDIRLVKC